MEEKGSAVGGGDAIIVDEATAMVVTADVAVVAGVVGASEESPAAARGEADMRA